MKQIVLNPKVVLSPNIALNPNQDKSKSLRKSLEYQGYTQEEIEIIIFEELLLTLSKKVEETKRQSSTFSIYNCF